jgi:dsDNA-binding SOS-regulon protein
LGDVDFDTQAIISLIDTFSTKDEYLMTVAYLRIIPQLENFSCLTPEEKLLKSIFPDHQNAHINVFTTNIENGTKTIFEEYKQLDITDDLDKWLTIRCLENKTLNKQNLSLFIQSYIDEYSAGDESLRKEVKKAIVLYIAKEKTDIVRNFFESFKRLKALRNLK